MKYAKIILIYLLALGVIEFTAQKHQSPQEAEALSFPTPTDQVWIGHSSASRAPASILNSPKTIKLRTQNFKLKNGSDYCPKEIIFTERKDCGGFELSDSDLNYKDQFCNIGKGLQKTKEKQGNDLYIQHLTVVKKDGKRYVKQQTSTAYSASRVIQKSQAEAQVIIQGRDIMLDYTVNGAGSSCLYSAEKITKKSRRG